MTDIDFQTTVGELLTARPALARVFEALGIDYCCGGKLSLQKACERNSLDTGTVVSMLLSLRQSAPETSTEDISGFTLIELADHIECTHHAFLRSELPRLEALTKKVATVHNHSDPRLQVVSAVFATMTAELLPHLLKEEQGLFPMIRALESPAELPAFHCGTLAHPVACMEREHDGTGAQLRLLRELTDGYALPRAACNSYRAMLDGLAQVERDLHQHIHKESNVLFPRAVEIERVRRGL
jgi:regulator of cell morphogenesis and NO signaling